MSAYNQHQEIHARLEAVQRQVSRIVACGIIGSFFIFMAGYSVGKKYGIEESYGSLSSDSFADMVYGAFRSAQEAFTPYKEPTSQEIFLYKDESRKNMNTEVNVLCGNRAYYAEIGRFGTSKEADMLSARLVEAGFDARVLTSVSETQGGNCYAWYRVCVYQDCAEADFMKAIEALGRRYRIKKKMSITNSHEVDDKVH